MNGNRPFVAGFAEKPGSVVEITSSYDEDLQMNRNFNNKGTEQETQEVTHGEEPDYERDFEDD